MKRFHAFLNSNLGLFTLALAIAVLLKLIWGMQAS